ncbi:MAG: citrate synthase/methylcitrate synthase, partial [Rhizobiaceae bacterium]|nr:citrate synthase/methylcitrate synthase [Rhizobiaceae bacterium]
MTHQARNFVPALTSEHSATGLENVVAAQTELSHVDGEAGRLVVRGYDLESLADWSFEAVLALLWRGQLGDEEQDEARIRAVLGKARVRAFELMLPLLPAADGLSQVEGLRLLLSSLADAETAPHHVLAVASVPVFAAAIARR